MRRGLLLLSFLLIALAVVPAATATKPIREIIPGQSDVLVEDQCAFPVHIHIDGSEIDTGYLDKSGELARIKGVFPGNTVTLTNLETSTAITLPATGSFQGRGEPDGSVTFRITGHGPFLTNPVTGEPGIWFLSGQLVGRFDAEGNVLSMEAKGTLVDLCPQLA